MSRLLIQAGGVAGVLGISGPATVFVHEGRIESVESGYESIAGTDVLDARTLVLAPGMIDVHTHGAAGAQAIDGTVRALEVMAAFYASHGVTGYLATVSGADPSLEAGLHAAHAIARVRAGARGAGGARCLGAHMEGPFISPRHRGAFVPQTIRPPDVSAFRRLVEIADGTLRLMTLAPELPGADDVLRVAAEQDVICAAGHSAASVADIDRAIELGLRSLTHLFNAMPPLRHREPGIVGAGLTDPRLTVELIADGVHVDPVACLLVSRAKGWSGITLVTDSIAATGLPDGAYHFEEQDIVVCAGEARLHDGTLAGSTLTLDLAVANFARFAQIPWAEALASATIVPARLLGMDRHKGEVAAGFDADLVAFDQQRAVAWTMVDGEVVYQR